MVHLAGDDYSPFNWIITFINFSALVLHLYVIYLIIYASPATMRQYRPYLALISLWDFLFTLALLMLTPDILYPSSCIVVNGPAGLLGRDFSLLFYVLAAFSGFNGLWTQDLCLLYRLVVVQRNNAVKKALLSWKITAAAQLLMCTASAWLTYWIWQSFYGDEASKMINSNRKYVDHWLYDERDATPPFNPDATLICQATYAGFGDPPQNITHNYHKVLEAEYLGAVQIGVVELLSVFLALMAFYTLHINRHYFSKFAAPFVFLMGPLAHMLFTAIFSTPRPSKALGDLYILSISLYGYANATLTLTFVAPYRHRAIDHVRRMMAKLGVRRKSTRSRSISDGNNMSTSISLSVRPSQETSPRLIRVR